MSVHRIEVEGSQEINGRDIEYTATVRLVYAPGRLSGPPEDCYPDESEAVVETSASWPEGFEDKLDEEKIEQQAWDIFDSDRRF